ARGRGGWAAADGTAAEVAEPADAIATRPGRRPNGAVHGRARALALAAGKAADPAERERYAAAAEEVVRRFAGDRPAVLLGLAGEKDFAAVRNRLLRDLSIPPATP